MTRLCAVMTDALVADPEYDDDVHVIVFIQGGGRGGIQLHNYDDDTEAIAQLVIHLKALFEANGKTLVVAPLGQG